MKKSKTLEATVVAILFILLAVWITLTIIENNKKENVDNIDKIIHNNDYSSKDTKVNSFKVTDITSLMIKQRIERLVDEKKERLEQQRLTKLKEEEEKKEVVVSRNNEPVGEWYVYVATFYTAGYESTGKTPDHPQYGITASGNYVQENHTVACPKELAFGTKLYIEGFGYRVCEDRGGAIKGDRLDIYVESLEEAYRLGKQKVNVKILN